MYKNGETPINSDMFRRYLLLLMTEAELAALVGAHHIGVSLFGDHHGVLVPKVEKSI